MVRILNALKNNTTLTKLIAQNNRFRVSRRLLSLIGDLVIYHNRVLRRIVLTCLAKSGGA